MSAQRDATPRGPRRRVPRALLFPAGAALLLVAALVAVSSSANAPPRAASERIIGLGFEDVVADQRDLKILGERIERLDPTGISVSAGRSDWTAFPWRGHEDQWAEPVQRTGTDYLGRAINLLAPRADGGRRDVTIVVDVLVERWIGTDPSIAGVSAEGERSELFASVSALDGPVGDHLVDFVDEIAVLYGPKAISLTELFLDTFTFGDDDLGSFMSFTGADDWPRTASGAIDENHPDIGAWRADAVTRLVERAATAAQRHGVELEMEVRASWDGPHQDPGQDGQDYGALLGVADRLVLWGYFGLSDVPAGSLERVARDLPPGTRDRFVMSVGLWATKGVISPSELATAVAAPVAGGVDSVWVTPASLMSADHWQALNRAWR